MTLFAGAVSLSGMPVPDDLAEALRSSLSRDPSHRPVERRLRSAYFAKIEIGAFSSSAFSVRPSGSASVLAGHPLLAGVTGRRHRHLEVLHDAWDRGDWTVLGSARGTYCAGHYDPVGGVLSLIGDKLGVRPIYYWVGPDLAVFATALRILETLRAVPKVLDLQGVTEEVAFGYSLAHRTPYSGIRVLQSGEVVQVGPGLFKQRRYWAWDQVIAARTDRVDSTEEMHELFVNAVRDRLGDERHAVAFLSGGLDSRCVVSALRDVGATVRTVTFYYDRRSQDAVLSAQVAEALGCQHTMVSRGGSRESLMTTMAATLRSWQDVDRAKAVWAGDGGSVGVGLVYVDPALVLAMRHGNERLAVDLLLRRYGSAIEGRFYARELAEVLKELPVSGALAELASLPAVDPARRIHLFLMVNDQRRHLAQHYEDVDLHGFDLQLPFFDADFLTSVMSAPIEESFGHRLYLRWLEAFSPPTRTVPWQAYPGHVPSPLPVPIHTRSQFDDVAERLRARLHRQSHLRSLWDTVRAADFPTPILSRPHLWLYLLAYRIGIGNYEWVARVADTYYRYWSRCEGAFQMPHHSST